MGQSALRSVGQAIGLGILLGPVQDYISQQVWENWTHNWEIEARAASGVATSGS